VVTASDADKNNIYVMG
jgi:hypothetical protein